MADFYSILKQSILERGLSTAAEREAVYTQARRAMTQRLWSYDPPLAETEIDSRVGLFEEAVERIESELVEAFARMETDAEEARNTEVADNSESSATRLARKPPRPAPLPARLRERPRPARPRPPTPPSPEISADDDFVAAVSRGIDAPRKTTTGLGLRGTAPAMPQTADPRPERSSRQSAGAGDQPERGTRRLESRRSSRPEAEDRPAEPRAFGRRRDRNRDHETRDGVEYGYDEDVRPDDRATTIEAEEVPFESYEDLGDDARYDDLPVEDDPYAEPEEEEAKRPRSGRGKSRRSPRRDREPGNEPRRRLSDKQLIRILAVAVAVLSIIFIIMAAFLVAPLIMSSRSVGSDAMTATASMPATTGKVVTQDIGDAASAAAIPEQQLAVKATYTVFKGEDPTVFQGSSDNPVVFDKDSLGSFARIASSTDAAGAKAVIRPGVAQDLAGHNIRVTLVARASHDNGATSMRFSFQTGLAVSHWQTAKLTSTYSAVGMTWRVPTMRSASGGDFIVIEPGIPGDGTAVDIQSIKIDVLAS